MQMGRYANVQMNTNTYWPGNQFQFSVPCVAHLYG